MWSSIRAFKSYTWNEKRIHEVQLFCAEHGRDSGTQTDFWHRNKVPGWSGFKQCSAKYPPSSWTSNRTMAQFGHGPELSNPDLGRFCRFRFSHFGSGPEPWHHLIPTTGGSLRGGVTRHLIKPGPTDESCVRAFSPSLEVTARKGQDIPTCSYNTPLIIPEKRYCRVKHLKV